MPVVAECGCCQPDQTTDLPQVVLLLIELLACVGDAVVLLQL